MADSPSPAGGERRGSSQGGPPTRPSTAGGAAAKSARQPPPSRRRASASSPPSSAVAQRLADRAEPAPARDSQEPPATAAPNGASAPATPRASGTRAQAPTPSAAPTPTTRRSSRPSPPASRRGGNPPGPVAESQPVVRPLSHRTLRNTGTGLTAPVGAPAPTVVPPAQPPRPRTTRRLGPLLDPAHLDVPVAVASTRRPLDVSNRYREERAASARKNKRFGLILMLGMIILLVGSAAGLWIGYRILTGDENHRRAVREAFNTWRARQPNDLRSRIDAAATALRPVYEDIPSGRSNPEQTAALNARYAAALRAASADYVWCRKTWKNGNQNLSINLSLDGATTFLTMPAQAKMLSTEPVVLPHLNGEPNQSATLVLYWDLEHQVPVAVVTLMLAPPMVTPVAGQPPPELVPPTQFTLWYNLPALEPLAQEYVDGPVSGDGDAP